MRCAEGGAYVEVDAADVRADLEGRTVGRGVDHSPGRREELTHRPAAACTHSERWLRTLSEYLERHVLRLLVLMRTVSSQARRVASLALTAQQDLVREVDRRVESVVAGR